MENHHCLWENPLEKVIFNSYVKLPEGNYINSYYKPSNFEGQAQELGRPGRRGAQELRAPHRRGRRGPGRLPGSAAQAPGAS
jgi:hypothetical protein